MNAPMNLFLPSSHLINLIAIKPCPGACYLALRELVLGRECFPGFKHAKVDPATSGPVAQASCENTSTTLLDHFILSFLPIFTSTSFRHMFILTQAKTEESLLATVHAKSGIKVNKYSNQISVEHETFQACHMFLNKASDFLEAIYIR